MSQAHSLPLLSGLQPVRQLRRVVSPTVRSSVMSSGSLRHIPSSGLSFVSICFNVTCYIRFSKASHTPAGSLHVSKPTWWLESRFHFNFADFYQGPPSFGCLRVLNDDLVRADAGFGWVQSHSSGLLEGSETTPPLMLLLWQECFCRPRCHVNPRGSIPVTAVSSKAGQPSQIP